MILAFLVQGFTQRGERTRLALLAFIRNQPGICTSELQRLSGLGWGTVRYELSILGRQGNVQFRRFGHRLTIYPPGIPASYLAWIHAMRDPLAGRLLQHVRSNPGLGVQRLADDFDGISRKTIRRHLTSLEQIGAVQRTDDYRPRFHAAAMPVQETGSLLLDEHAGLTPARRDD